MLNPRQPDALMKRDHKFASYTSLSPFFTYVNHQLTFALVRLLLVYFHCLTFTGFATFSLYADVSAKARSFAYSFPKRLHRSRFYDLLRAPPQGNRRLNVVLEQLYGPLAPLCQGPHSYCRTWMNTHDSLSNAGTDGRLRRLFPSMGRSASQRSCRRPSQGRVLRLLRYILRVSEYNSERSYCRNLFW